MRMALTTILVLRVLQSFSTIGINSIKSGCAIITSLANSTFGQFSHTNIIKHDFKDGDDNRFATSIALDDNPARIDLNNSDLKRLNVFESLRFKLCIIYISSKSKIFS